ncbi:MAG TPA: FecR domain-containing protein [Gemmatimonadaceae bacterium]|jgi:ferric-dicitrate binding protein FerR (iron transport regulator)|nr:FecR domain-containing protein [Gemmatimonadaceae bacterium]
MMDDPIWRLLDRYFSGSCTADELQYVTSWVGDDPARARYLASVERVWNEARYVWDEEVDADEGHFDASAAWGAVRDRMSAARGHDKSARTLHLYPAREERSSSKLRWWICAAAVCLVAVPVGLLWPRLVARSGMTASTADAAMREYATVRGQRAEILLADGTRAILNVESRLRVPVTYGAGARDVYLEGEALFEVTHDEKAPFRVHAAGLLAEDIGTEFVVRAYPEDGPTVVVTSGAVAVHGDSVATSRSVTLTAGQLGRVDAEGRLTVRRDVDLATHTAWTEGRLEFDETPLSQVARELERWYDLDITIADSSLGHAVLTASFENQPLNEVLSVVTRTLDIRYTRNGSHVRFSARASRR